MLSRSLRFPSARLQRLRGLGPAPMARQWQFNTKGIDSRGRTDFEKLYLAISGSRLSPGSLAGVLLSIVITHGLAHDLCWATSKNSNHILPVTAYPGPYSLPGPQYTFNKWQDEFIDIYLNWSGNRPRTPETLQQDSQEPIHPVLVSSLKHQLLLQMRKIRCSAKLVSGGGRIQS